MHLQITDGARFLRAWLRANGLNIPRFCEIHGIDRIQVQRAVNGGQRRFSVDFALSVERATEGAVPVASWASETLRGDDAGPKKAPVTEP